ncbi:phage tail fiber protein [Escherichia coli]|uniref:phage tail protein n=1 Tax=Escherichia coli TaxID=562 RepID=UPI0010B78644|nr:phage tail protein [Escherichia coli]GCI43181.1 phage tail fiber protein [Escherichia coli]
MAGTNDFKAFATDANANVTSQEEWETLTALKKGFSSGKASSAQVSKALRQPSTMAAVLGQFIANAELDALDDGDVDGLVAKLATAITTNLGLGEGSALPVGVPVPWPSATPPTGWLKCNGAVFSSEKYPNLAKAYPTLKLPDLRGEFIRGWDDGRGIDSGRNLLSAQNDAIQNIVGSFGRTQLFRDVLSSGPFSQHGQVLSTGLKEAEIIEGYGAYNWTFDASRSVRTASETRSRNIAFNYIVRAA